MTLSRRSFIRTLGASGAGVAAMPFVAARGSEALAGARAAAALSAAAGSTPPSEAALRLATLQQAALHLGTNENPNGPSRAALDAVRAAFAIAAEYPYEYVEDLRLTIADMHGINPDSVLIGSGSSEILRMALYACVTPQKHLVTAAPTYEDPAYYAQLLGADIQSVRVDAALKLDLPRMAAAARNAGLVFLCNPNNPTGTLHSATTIADFVRTVRQNSRDTVVLIDEAYHEFVDDPSHKSAVHLAAENPNVILSRTFSKAFGMAGLRVGYAVARPDTLAPLLPHRLVHGVNLLGARAAKACVRDDAHIANERRLNQAARQFTAEWFQTAGYQVTPSHANFILVNIRRDSLAFQYSCAELGVLVGRPFPPLTTHARISIGSMDDMRKAVDVFRRVLGRR
jgi:histidinol-phosphate aminotransferase